MLKKQPIILRLTVRIDPDDGLDMGFAKGFLRRMDVLHVQTNPKKAVADILSGGKIGEFRGKTVVALGPPKGTHTTVEPNGNKQEPSKPKLLMIKELKMPLPEFVRLEFEKQVDNPLDLSNN